MNDALQSQSNQTETGSGTAITAVTRRELSVNAKAFLKTRGLSEKTLALMPVAFGMGSGDEALFFDQRVDGVSHGWKARSLTQKKFWQKPGTPQRLWNLDQVAGSERVFITEGELDALALVEAGVSPREVVSIWGGAKAEEDQNLKQADDALEQLVGVKTIVLAMDADDPGRALRSCLAKVLGAARCRFVDWPEGIKDANEMLVKDGAEALRDLVTNGSMAWPVDGLYRLSELPDPPAFELWDAGFPEWEGGVQLAPTMLSVVTGHGGHGKTVFMTQVWQQIALRYGIKIAVASMETRAKPHYRRNLRQLMYSRPERELTPMEMRDADHWIEDHYRFLQHPDERPTLAWLLDTLEVAVVREGCRAVVIDPWNKLERQRDHRQSETDYIGEVLSELHRFSRDLRCHTMVIAHPTKDDVTTRGKAPDLQSIAGSKAWETMPDHGMVMWREKVFEAGERITDARFIVRKARFEELGYPRHFDVKYDLDKCRFVPVKGV